MESFYLHINSVSLQVYISEISLPNIRGCLSAMLKVLTHVGVLLSYIAGSYLNWRQSALLVAVAPSLLFLGTLFIPETPSYLVLNGKDDEAASSLQWLRGSRVDIRHELQVRLLHLSIMSFSIISCTPSYQRASNALVVIRGLSPFGLLERRDERELVVGSDIVLEALSYC